MSIIDRENVAAVRASCGQPERADAGAADSRGAGS
jgi:hypothetical protein